MASRAHTGIASHRDDLRRLAVFALLLLAAASCRRAPQSGAPVATPAVTLNRDQAPLGSPIDLTYRFEVAPDAHLTEDYRVMVHVVDVDDQMIFAFDHSPAVPTTEWRPGQTIEYTRTEFIPVVPYVGQASLQLGLYSTATQKRLPLRGADAGQRAYRVAQLQIRPQTDNVYTVFSDGWHPAETAEHNSKIEWQWTKKNATLSFKNPRKDSTLYLELDNPGGPFSDPQRVQLSIGPQTLETFTVTPGAAPVLHKIPIAAAALSKDDMVELRFQIDKTFVPALLNTSSKDPRELGVRVFHAFILPSR
jgi:hypothetical protein